MNKELEHKGVWTGEYKGIKFEIVNWKLGDFLCWNYYLCLPIEQIPIEYHKYFILPGKYRKLCPDGQAHLMYNYNGAAYISDLDWHGDITFYEKQRDSEGKIIGVKLGCDYAHHFDKQVNYSYNIDYVLMETKQTINKLHVLIPNLKVRCQWNGNYYNQNECEDLPQGGFLARENKGKWFTPLGIEQ